MWTRCGSAVRRELCVVAAMMLTISILLGIVTGDRREYYVGLGETVRRPQKVRFELCRVMCERLMTLHYLCCLSLVLTTAANVGAYDRVSRRAHREHTVLSWSEMSQQKPVFFA